MLKHPVKGDDNYHIIFTLRDNWEAKGVQISHGQPLYQLDDYGQGILQARASQMLAQPPLFLDLVMCTGTDLGWWAATKNAW